jgi:hypothetical protein
VSTETTTHPIVVGMTELYAADEEAPRPALDASRLWAGGIATAAVAALITVAGVVIARGLFGVSILAPKGAGVWGDASTGWYAFGAALVSLAATGLAHLLVLFTPKPMRFFGWVIGLATVIAVIAPFLGGGRSAAQFATGILNLVLGAAIGSLVAGSARGAVRAVPR